MSSNVALSYKECSLQQDWIGLNGINSPGILLFHSFPDITQIPPLIEPQELNDELLQTLLGTNSITNHLVELFVLERKSNHEDVMEQHLLNKKLNSPEAANTIPYCHHPNG